MDNVYEVLWESFKQKIALAQQHSLRNDITLDQLGMLINTFEAHFAKDIEEAMIKKQKEEVKEETGLDLL